MGEIISILDFFMNMSCIIYTYLISVRIKCVGITPAV